MRVLETVSFFYLYFLLALSMVSGDRNDAGVTVFARLNDME